MLTDPTEITATAVWTIPAFRARAAQERHSELRAQDEAEIDKRNQALREAANGGASVAELARMVGITRPTLYGILGTAP